MANRKYGVVYTPDRLSKFVAELLYRELKADSASCEKILDPACGECALLSAMHYLCGDNSEYFGLDVDRDVSVDKPTNMHVIINDSILPRNVKSKTEEYWVKKIGVMDTIIANPPWSSEKIYERDELKRAGYTLINGQYDSYVLFVELSYKLLKNNGYMAFIIPDSLFDAQNEELRRFLATNMQVKVIARLGEKIFEEVNRATTIIICQKTKPDANTKTKCFRLSTEDRRSFLLGEAELIDLYDAHVHQVYQARFINNDACNFDIDTRLEEEELISKIRQRAISWNDLFVFGRGVEISKTGKIVICPKCGYAQGYKKKQFISGKKTCTNCDKEIAVTASTIKNMVSKVCTEDTMQIYVGENVKRYTLEPGSYIKPSVPGINYKDISMYNPPKLLVRKTGLGIYAAIDYTGSMTSQTVYILKQKKGNVVPLEYYLALLNSRVVYYYYLKIYGENEWKSHPYLTKQIIFSLPVIPFEGSSVDAEIIALSSKLAQSYDYKIDMELENKIIKKYGLTADEVKLIRDEINKLPDLSAINNMKFEE